MVFRFCKFNCISKLCKLWGRCSFECIPNSSIRKWGIFSSYKNLTNRACRHISNYDLRSAGMSLVYVLSCRGNIKESKFLVTHQVHCSRTQNYISSVPRYLCTLRPTYSWSRILLTTLISQKRFFSLLKIEIHLIRQHVLGGEGCPHVPMVKRSQYIRIKNPLHKHFAGMPMVGE